MYKRGKRLSDGHMWVQKHDGEWISLIDAAENYSTHKQQEYIYAKTRE